MSMSMSVLARGSVVLLPLASALLSTPVVTTHPLGRSFSPTNVQPAIQRLPSRTPAVFLQEVAHTAPPSTGHSRVGWFARVRTCGRALLAAGAFALMTPRRAFASVGAVPLQGRLLYALQQAVVRNAGLAVAIFFVSAVVTGGWFFYKVNPDTGSLGLAARFEIAPTLLVDNSWSISPPKAA